MITISLDETNGFEEWCKSDAAVFVGGIIYDDEGNPKDTIAERKRIIEYYTMAIEDATGDKTLFPRALHTGHGCDGSVKAVKEQIRKTFGEFIKNGTYNGKLIKPARTGKYYIFVNMKTDEGISELSRDATNILSRDDYASNLYFHMATGIINRLVFHNPVIPNIKEVAFNLASRESPDFDAEKDAEKLKEYRRLGVIRKGDKSDNKVHFTVAGPEMYRVALAQKMLENKKTSIAIKDFRVWSINYENNVNMEFLYLADSLCSVIQRNLEEKGLKSQGATKWIKAIDGIADSINEPSQNMVFAYDDVDVRYSKAWEAYEAGDLYSAIETIHNAEQDKGEFTQYYKKKWFKILRGKIESIKKLEYLADAVNELGRPLKSNEYSQGCGLDIFKSLVKIADANMDEIVKRGRERLLCQLYSQGISVYCHMGDSKNAQRYFNKYKKYRHLLRPDEYISALLRVAEVELDQFQWDKAEKNAMDCIDMQLMISEMVQETDLFGVNNEVCSSELGKAYSLMGQIKAFKRDEYAEDSFRNALKNFAKDGPDYKITQSYLLHHYIDMGYKEKYETEATAYFGGNTSASKRLGYILKHAFEDYPVINYRYALYVFIKGLYVFEKEDVSDDLYAKIINLNDLLKKTADKDRNKKGSFVELKNHPSEIIYEYLAMLAWDRNDKENSLQYIDRVLELSEDDGTIIKLIRYSGAKEYYAHIGEEDNEKKMAGKITEMLNSFSLGDGCDIGNMLTYMYR